MFTRRSSFYFLYKAEYNIRMFIRASYRYFNFLVSFSVKNSSMEMLNTFLRIISSAAAKPLQYVHFLYHGESSLFLKRAKIIKVLLFLHILIKQDTKQDRKCCK